MWDWENQSIALINEQGFRVSDPGPLHAPVDSFKIRRDKKLGLVIETETALDAKSTAEKILSGTLRYNTDTATIIHQFIEAKAILSGVQTLSVSQHGNRLQEIATVHELTTTLLDPSKAAYTIEWVDNMPTRYLWPDSIDTETKNTATLTISDLVVTDTHSSRGGSSAAARLTVAGHTVYVCAPSRNAESREGCIVYSGAPEDLLRKKVRTALSFAFGHYLFETGHTVYNDTWGIVSASSVSSYSLDGRAVDLQMMPLTWLTERNLQFDIGRQKLQRMVERLVSAYDDLDLGNLAWAYWHARTATAHIAPAHFGAAIEALQRGYAKVNPGKIRTKILPDAQWDGLREAMKEAITRALISEDDKVALKQKLTSGTNAAAQRGQLKALANLIKIEIGPDEDAAWLRRNKAAHGIPIPEVQELEAFAT